MATSNLSRATVILWQRQGAPPNQVVTKRDLKIISVIVDDPKNAEAQIIAEYLRTNPLPGPLQDLINDIAGGLVTIADIRTVAITLPS